ncbi:MULTISPECIES: hypothetical protein [unclassified Rhodococcus (in: high G+C Gram-positive bacteria)]|nr:MULTISPECIES: hypothetical protein [unclassified Rhodococcus (in: high G+C Gram-positive bacteria)]
MSIKDEDLCPDAPSSSGRAPSTTQADGPEVDLDIFDEANVSDP